MSQKKIEKARSSLYDLFFATLRPLYSKEITDKLAEAHCEAHKQFLHEMYLDAGGDRRGGARKVARDGKPMGKVQKKRSGLMQRAKKVIGKSKVIVSKSKAAPMQDVKREILSYLSGFAEPVALAEIHGSLATQFDWSISQVKRAMRELRESKQVEQIGSKKFAKYQVTAPFVQMAPAEAAAEGQA
ncbi:MAG: hypothetical protein WC683_03095 [bacterium]